MWPQVKQSGSFAPKDWIATSISVLALVISAATAYFNLVRTTDSLSMVAASLPELRVRSGDTLELSTPDVLVILINSGTRRAAISSFVVSVSQLRNDARHKGSECLDEMPQEDRTQIYTTGLSGLIISDKEVRTQSFQLRPTAGPITFPMAPFNKGAREFVVVACFNIDAVTPSAADISSYQIVREWQVNRATDGTYNVLVSDKPDGKKPLQIYRRVGTMFSD